MKKLLSILIALAMVAVMIVSCSENDPPADTSNDTETPVETPADTEEKKPVETETPPETEDIAIDDPEAPKQPDVPCNFDEVYDLSEEIMVSEFMLEARMGMWITATDDDLMEKYINKELLEEYKYLAITYETDYVEEGYQMELLFKFHHSDETRTEFLCDDWYIWALKAQRITDMNLQQWTSITMVSSMFLPNSSSIIPISEKMISLI